MSFLRRSVKRKQLDFNEPSVVSRMAQTCTPQTVAAKTLISLAVKATACEAFSSTFFSFFTSYLSPHAHRIVLLQQKDLAYGEVWDFLRTAEQGDQAFSACS